MARKVKPTLEPLGYRLEDVHQVLPISTSKVRQLVRSGELPAARIGTAVIVTKESIRDFLAKNTAQPPAKEAA